MRNKFFMQAAAGTIMLLSSSAFGQVIRIHKEVTIDQRQDVRLGDVAKISGVDAKTAESLANLVILPNVQESRSIRAESVLTAVIAQIGPGKLAENLQVSGSATCDVKLETAETKRNPQTTQVQIAPQQAVISTPVAATATPSTPEKTQDSAGPTLSSLVLAELQKDLGVGADDLRVSFTVMNPLLDQPTPTGKKWIIRPLTRTFLGTVQFEAQLVEGNRVVQKLNVQTQVLKRERILTATVPLSRGDVVTLAHFRLDEAWIDRQLPTLLQNEKEVVGLEALRPVSVGSMLDQRDFRPVQMANRNDPISVVYTHGHLKMQMKGVAMQDGKLNDSIKVKNEFTNEIYQATLVGKGFAVVGQN